MLTAASGTGKSLLNLQVAVQVACGVHPFDQTEPIPPQRVLYVQAENDTREEGRRLAMMADLAAKWGPVRDNFLALVPDGELAGINLGTPQGVAFLRRKIRKWQPRLVVVGPWKDLHGGFRSEGDGGEAAFGRVKQQLDHMRRRFGFALWIEAHASSDSKGSQNLDHYTPRGTIAQQNWAHYGLALIPLVDDDNNVVPGQFRLGQWRGGRSRDRWWPKEMREGTPGRSWPWVPSGVGSGGRVAQAWGAA
jgi:RecA-family ATPase